MTATNNFFTWYFSGLNGLGGWFVFFLLALAAVIWMLYDSNVRRLQVVGWKIGVILLASLLLPSMLYRFSGLETQLSLAPFVEVIFYLGLLGGVLPPVLAIGYFITYQGMVGCTSGHIYEANLGSCPECAREAALNAPQPVIVHASPPRSVVEKKPPIPQPQRPQKPYAQAWLTASDGHSSQLYRGETTIGRHSSNDIQYSGDTTISKNHAKILEQNGHFKLVDLASTNGTRVNGRLVREPIMLEVNDEIQFGDHKVVRFIAGQR